jgi:hypothetical protein
LEILTRLTNKQLNRNLYFFFLYYVFFVVVAGKVEKQNLVNLDSNLPLDPGSISIQQSNNTHGTQLYGYGMIGFIWVLGMTHGHTHNVYKHIQPSHIHINSYNK